MTYKFLAIIPARGGSKGIPKKNICLVKGKPLIYYSIEAALASKYIKQTIVTTDSEEISAVSSKYPVIISKRSEDISGDNAKTSEAVLDVLKQLGDKLSTFSHIVLLQPTSPLRTAKHIDECIEEYIKSGALSAISITESEHHPYKTFIEKEGVGIAPLSSKEYLSFPRQSLPKSFRQNGAIYIVPIADFINKEEFYIEPVYFYKMTNETSIDIDAQIDLVIAEKLL
jgi:CMP-N-acetylneuraminic acid synthetase